MINHFKIYLLVSISTIMLIFNSCEKFDLVRVMDTQTGEIEINKTSVIAKGTILDIGSKNIINHGHCWSIGHEPSIEDNKTDLGQINEKGEFTSVLYNIIADTTHYIRSYIFDGKDYVYGDILTFKVSAEDLNFWTYEYERINESKINITSTVEGVGSLNFTDHGHCWATHENPTFESNVSSYGPLINDNTFTSKIVNLNLGHYYIRAYLKSEGRIIYSNTITFDSEISVTTGIVAINDNSSATAYGSIISLGASTIQDHGHCWSATTSYPNISDERVSKTSLGSVNQLISFTSELTGLLPDIPYYTRAYAIDGSKVYYGEVKSFIINP
ncbi:MAG: hypothetical protein JXR51_10795 [Bacteroidales bacterium]|nr:hypothetical protein [Bacteroidales bacterium]